ncbi:MAG: GNAT family N-acetyltransferase [Phycisphaerales bacterium]|nr:GNAT family N-acetyltransferase [Phycisphaerales bacterium]MCI0630617.1 GNAT family N-acetyltransferase [Phycisphaerales bacterium]MCI0674202.1 GNAT family N-acetyltransferase [Phycisphaerales bacterium]
MAAPQVGPTKSAKELSALLDILAPTFNFSREHGERYSQIVGKKNYRVIRDGSKIAGGCALLPMGQFFGGQSVPMMGVAAVAIAPEHRGQSAASILMKSLLVEIHQRGFPLSALYPATLPLYRRVGYEQAGIRYEIRIPAKTMILRDRAPADGLELRSITHKDHRAIAETYRTRAARTAGNLDRTEFNWSRIREPRGQVTQGFMVLNTSTDKPEGHVFILKKDSTEAPYSLHLTDLVAITPAAGRKLLWLLADHRSMTDQITFQGTPDDPIVKLLPERNYTARLLDHWMVRIVDVAAALKARGYSPHVRAEVTFAVDDDLLPLNSGTYTLKVADGKPTVRRSNNADRANIQIDIRGLAALYSGHMSPDDLLTTGQITAPGSKSETSQSLSALAAIFAGPAPWMSDMF